MNPIEFTEAVAARRKKTRERLNTARLQVIKGHLSGLLGQPKDEDFVFKGRAVRVHGWHLFTKVSGLEHLTLILESSGQFRVYAAVGRTSDCHRTPHPAVIEGFLNRLECGEDSRKALLTRCEEVVLSLNLDVFFELRRSPSSEPAVDAASAMDVNAAPPVIRFVMDDRHTWGMSDADLESCGFARDEDFTQKVREAWNPTAPWEECLEGLRFIESPGLDFEIILNRIGDSFFFPPDEIWVGDVKVPNGQWQKNSTD